MKNLFNYININYFTESKKDNLNLRVIIMLFSNTVNMYLPVLVVAVVHIK